MFDLAVLFSFVGLVLHLTFLLHRFPDFQGIYVPIVLLFNLVLSIALLYSLWFAATSVSIGTNYHSPNKASTFGFFICFIYLVVVVWILQPRINKIKE
jgi:ABC-type transport system involved in multi-copper enzyme maturation permease subunit